MITKKERQFLILLITIAIIAAMRLNSVEPVDLIDTPSAYTLDRGFYNVGFFVYDNGGIYVRTLIGITENITLGVSETVDYAISPNAAVWHIPMVIARLRLLGGPPDAFHLALGFGPQAYSSIGQRLGEPVQGAYLVARKGFAFIVPDIFQFFTLGVRYPLLPETYRQQNFVSAFAGFSTRIGKEFEVKLEAANITFRQEEPPVFCGSVGIHFTEMFEVELDVQYSYRNNAHFFNRMVKLNYYNIFY